MNILLACDGTVPVLTYGGTQRVVWSLGKALAQLGHSVTFLVRAGSHSDFASVLALDPDRPLAAQVPPHIDVVHLHSLPAGELSTPHIVTVHGNPPTTRSTDRNAVYVSQNHAFRFSSESYVYNGLDWDDYGPVRFDGPRPHCHFLAEAAWRAKNVRGAIEVIKRTRRDRLAVIGGSRLNLRMGFRFTASRRVQFHGKLGGERKLDLIRHSKALIFPVIWNEPFGLALIESLYFGCPIFGTPYGSLPELIPPEVGVLAASATELAAGVEDADKFDRRRCHEYARDRFNARTMALAYLERYETVLNGRTLNAEPPRLRQPVRAQFPWGA